MQTTPEGFANEGAGRRERFLALTDALRDALWRADALGHSRTLSIPTGYSSLDPELPGNGWPAASLTELLWTQQGSGELRVVAPALKTLSQAGKTIILLGSPHDVVAPALDQMGIDCSNVLLVDADKSSDRLWTAEQILKSDSIGALLSWHPTAKPEHLRRLQVAATACEGLCFIIRPASTRLESSPAPLRLFCESAPFGQLSVEVFKRRGPAAATPVLLPALFAPSMQRALDRAWRSSIVEPVETPVHVDRSLPAPATVRPGVPSLA